VSGGRRTVLLALPLLLPSACLTSPPDDPDDLCSIFREKRGWYRAARSTAERWGVPEPVQLAVLFRESSFRARARPPRRRLLGFLPGPRPSSAYGYGQVVDATWDAYRRASGRHAAARDDFGDVVDFLGWYGHRIHRRTGVSTADAYAFYLAYHEGPGGFARGTHRGKAWLLRAARQVEGRARRYAVQYAGCREALEREQRWWWPF